ncbi:MAG: response regulator transcription factor [Cytophagales bacterium]|nr:response regulator transcription factor [Cytophagales bacterium]
MIRLLLADNFPVMREGVKALLSADPTVEVVGEAAHFDELAVLTDRTGADVLLLGTDTPDKQTVHLVRSLSEKPGAGKILVCTQSEQESDILQLLDAGAGGYVLRNTEPEELRFAIHSLAKGNPYICSKITLNLLRTLNNEAPGPARLAGKHPDNLSRREMEVLGLIAQGYTNAQIADKLFTSKRTIETHRQNLLEKTNSSNTATLIRYAVLRGLIQ